MASIDAAALFKVEGMIAVVTGAGSGLGLTMATALANNGASKVYILGRRLSSLESAASQATHKNIVPIQCDVTSKDSLAAAASQIQSESGHIHLLIANSGVSGPKVWPAPDASLTELRDTLWSMPSAEVADTFAVNVTGVLFTAVAFLELLDAGNKVSDGFGAATGEERTRPIQSQIVVTGSIGAFGRSRAVPLPNMASKAAVTQMTKGLSSLLSGFGIRANVLAPGLFPSEMTGSMVQHRKVEEEPPSHPGFTPARRLGSDEDIAGTILYLASRAGAYCNGVVLIADGGRLGVYSSSY